MSLNRVSGLVMMDAMSGPSQSRSRSAANCCRGLQRVQNNHDVVRYRLGPQIPHSEDFTAVRMAVARRQVEVERGVKKTRRCKESGRRDTRLSLLLVYATAHPSRLPVSEPTSRKFVVQYDFVKNHGPHH